MYMSTKDKIEYIKDKKNISPTSFALLMFILYLVFQSWIAILPATTIWQVAIVGSILVVLALKYVREGIKKPKITMIDIAWVLAYIFIITNILRVGAFTYKVDIYIYSVGVLLLLLSKVKIREFNLAFSTIKFGAIVYTLGTNIQYFFTDSFNKIIFPIVYGTNENRAAELLAENYYPGFAMGRPANAAFYMVIGLGIIISLWHYRTKGKKILDSICFPLIFIALIMTGKRSILFWTIISLIVMYFYLNGFKCTKKLFWTITVLLLAMGLTFFILTKYQVTVPFLSRLIKTLEGLLSGKDVTSGRTKLYRLAWGMFLNNPLFGVGWKQFQILSLPFLSRELSVHNVYLQLLCETGIVGFIMVTIPLFYTYCKTWEIARMAGNNRNINALWKAGIDFSLYYQTFFLLYCLTENPFYNILYMLLYFFVIAIISSYVFIKGYAKGKIKTI